MPCLCPLDAWPAPPGAPDRRPVFSPQASYQGAKAFSVPCGQCMGCRVSRTQEWQLRIVHEAKMHEANCFATLTYSNEHLPSDMSVSISEMQLFYKRLRKEVGPVRNVTCGEYSPSGRPHYHAILHGHDFAAERQLWSRSKAGELLYRAPTLEKVWPYGHVLITDVTPRSAAYVAGYVTKKVTGKRAADHYARRLLDPETGELVREWTVAPEFLISSRRPGIGAAWFDEFGGDAFPSDFLILEGKRVPVPRYYLRKLAEAERLRTVAKRKVKALAHADNNTDSRLRVRNECAELREAKRKRDGLEGDF